MRLHSPRLQQDQREDSIATASKVTSNAQNLIETRSRTATVVFEIYERQDIEECTHPNCEIDRKRNRPKIGSSKRKSSTRGQVLNILPGSHKDGPGDQKEQRANRPSV